VEIGLDFLIQVFVDVGQVQLVVLDLRVDLGQFLGLWWGFLVLGGDALNRWRQGVERDLPLGLVRIQVNLHFYVGPLQPLALQRTRAEVLLALLQLLLSERAFQVGIERFLLVESVVEGNPGFLLVGTGVVLNVDFFPW